MCMFVYQLLPDAVWMDDICDSISFVKFYSIDSIILLGYFDMYDDICVYVVNTAGDTIPSSPTHTTPPHALIQNTILWN